MFSDLQSTVNFLFEIGILTKTPRSGFHFLGSGAQSVAEHTHRVVYIGFVLGTLTGNVDVGKIMKMCLFHDLAEGRTSDLNYVHQKYVHSDERAAMNDLALTLPFGDAILSIQKEYGERVSSEAMLAKDADQLEWILSLKEQDDIGNSRAKLWIPSAVKRLKTEIAQKLAEKILTTNSDEWWFTDRDGDWWVNRNKKATEGRV